MYTSSILQGMKVRYSYPGIRFEWDSRKASGNLKKHGIPFETASEAFLDPFARIVDVEMKAGMVN